MKSLRVQYREEIPSIFLVDLNSIFLVFLDILIDFFSVGQYFLLPTTLSIQLTLLKLLWVSEKTLNVNTWDNEIGYRQGWCLTFIHHNVIHVIPIGGMPFQLPILLDPYAVLKVLMNVAFLKIKLWVIRKPVGDTFIPIYWWSSFINRDEELMLMLRILGDIKRCVQHGYYKILKILNHSVVIKN